MIIYSYYCIYNIYKIWTILCISTNKRNYHNLINTIWMVSNMKMIFEFVHTCILYIGNQGSIYIYIYNIYYCRLVSVIQNMIYSNIKCFRLLLIYCALSW